MGLGSHVMHGVSDQGMPLTVKETQEQAHDQGPIVPHTSHPEAASLAECESGLLQAQLKCHVGGSALGGGPSCRVRLCTESKPLKKDVSPVRRA